MKRSIYFLLLLLIISVPALAQRRSALSKFVPRQLIGQYAGSIGMASIGVGYPFSYHRKMMMSFHYGYVPETYGGRLDILTAKLHYQPFRIPLDNKTVIYPLNPELFFSYTMNKGFYLSWPKDQYSKGYYWWSSGLRWHVGLSSEIKFKFDPGKNKIKATSFYVEANTNDLYLYSYTRNGLNPGYLSLGDIIKVGVGMKLHF